LSTESGNIDVGIEPVNYSRWLVDEQDPDQGHPIPVPATFSATTDYGKVNAAIVSNKMFGKSGIPDRDYKTFVQTTDGKIEGDFLLGSEASFKSISGDLQVQVVPYAATNHTNASLSTEIEGGYTYCTVLDPVFLNGSSSYNNGLSTAGDISTSEIREYWNSFRASWTAGHGSMQPAIPSSWTGTIEYTTSTGLWDIDEAWEEVVRSWSRPGERKLFSKHESGNSILQLRTLSGEMQLRTHGY
jgi:hypothetical protein